jgi:hypothetical protein
MDPKPNNQHQIRGKVPGRDRIRGRTGTRDIARIPNWQADGDSENGGQEMGLPPGADPWCLALLPFRGHRLALSLPTSVGSHERGSFGGCCLVLAQSRRVWGWDVPLPRSNSQEVNSTENGQKWKKA